jgi:hypothetical protein
MKVMTFSTRFPSYHPKAGQETYFIEQIWNSLGGVKDEYRTPFENYKDYTKSILWSYRTRGEKGHTIRAGHRWKAGDKFSPRIWSGKPYRSKQIAIADPIEVVKVWDFKIEPDGKIFIGNTALVMADVQLVAKNDGLTAADFLAWFKHPKPFDGQIICWNKNINYYL